MTAITFLHSLLNDFQRIIATSPHPLHLQTWTGHRSGLSSINGFLDAQTHSLVVLRIVTAFQTLAILIPSVFIALYDELAVLAYWTFIFWATQAPVVLIFGVGLLKYNFSQPSRRALRIRGAFTLVIIASWLSHVVPSLR